MSNLTNEEKKIQINQNIRKLFPLSGPNYTNYITEYLGISKLLENAIP